jgi:hypothetical protein
MKLHDLKRRFAEGDSKYLTILCCLMTLLVLSCYLVPISGGAGGEDLMLRISEARYFMAGINPYDVYTGKVPSSPELGHPNAYSFFSYYFASPFALLSSPFLQKSLFAIIDMIALTAGLVLTARMAAMRKHAAIPLVMAVLLLSPFFYQHVNTLNYNLIASLGVILVFHVLQAKTTWMAVVGVILLGLKPSLAIPTIMCLSVFGNWKLLVYPALSCLLLMVLVCLRIDTNPFEIVSELRSIQAGFSNGHTDGMFFLFKPAIGNYLLLLGLVLSAAVVLTCKARGLLNPRAGIVLSLSLGVSLFYNHVHAWIAVYPLLVFATADLYRKRSWSTWIPFLLILMFLCLPRLAGIVDPPYRHLYVGVHNLVRFGALFFASAWLVRNATEAATETGRHKGAACADAPSPVECA